MSGVSAGGCRNNLETFAMNPQYTITLVDHDEDDEDDKCTLIVALMQKNHRAKRKMGLDSLTLGFAIYKLEDGQFQTTDNPAAQGGHFRHQMLTTEYFKYNASVARSPTFINLREVSSRFRLPPGNKRLQLAMECTNCYRSHSHSLRAILHNSVDLRSERRGRIYFAFVHREASDKR